MLKLTQCLIVKNEEQNLPRALNWGENLFDEQIVIDTGSSDGSVALAEKLGAKVMHFAWIDDFSAAKNFAIAQCTGEWIFFLDADEYFAAEHVPLLRPLIERISGSSVKEEEEIRPYNVVETPWINVSSNKFSQQARIFRNVPYLRYSGAIHEQIHALPGGYLRVYAGTDAPAILHDGYVWTSADSKGKKAARNFEIARKALKKSPNCSKLQLFAAEALMFKGEYLKAEKFFSEAMKNADGSIWPERAREGYKQWLNNYLNRNDSGTNVPRDRLPGAMKVHAEAVAKFPDDADFDILLSLLCFKAKDILNTILFFNASLAKKNGRITENLMASNSEIYQRLRVTCEKLRNH
ncbi:MAG TPA: glycosyltransferase family 2 protein [Patescibacteria group bacterium]|nr:glycosyltransferase family 2 protein [Patescibacteria group bacterium]